MPNDDENEALFNQGRIAVLEQTVKFLLAHVQGREQLIEDLRGLTRTEKGVVHLQEFPPALKRGMECTIEILAKTLPPK